MTDEDFFSEPTEQSQVKARIVDKYFRAWAKVVIPNARRHSNCIAYVDLFAGPGQYKDGTISTPIMVLKGALADPVMCEMLVTIFNDKIPNNAEKLRQAINALPEIRKLKHEPRIRS